jgi:hypothetical protein
MNSVATLPEIADQLLRLCRRDRAQAATRLNALDEHAQVGIICEAPVARRAELLGMLDNPESVVPLLPEAELCFIAKAIGLHDAGWLLGMATPEQWTTCLDLDSWNDRGPDADKFSEWMVALVDTGDDTALRVSHEIDPELIYLWLAERIDVVMTTKDGEEEVPDAAQTLDGQFYYAARHDKDDLAEITTFLRLLFQKDYWRYFRMLQAVSWELPTENVEWARRWREGRLQDLGFPDEETALSIYALIPEHTWEEIPEEYEIGAWALPVWMPRLPELPDETPSLLRALLELDEEGRRAALYRLIALANRVAVADQLPLGDAETVPAALQKALRVASTGLEYVATRRGLSHLDVARRASLTHLFRVGANLDRGVIPERRAEEEE